MTSVIVPERILLVRLSHLGDVVLSMGLFHALHAAFPRAEIAWAIQPEFADLVRPLPGLTRVIPFERQSGWRAWPRIRRELRAFAPDLVVDIQANLKSGAITKLSGARRRTGLARVDWRESLGFLAINDPLAPRPAGDLHAVHHTLALARHLTGVEGSPPMDPSVSAAEREAGERELDRRMPGASESSVILKLSPTGDTRGWSVDHWVSLGKALRAQGRGILFLAGPEERDTGDGIQRAMGPEADGLIWNDQVGLRELAGFFTAAAGRGLRYVGCDSGPLHLAAACGLSCIALSGPTDERRTGPWPLEGFGPHRIARLQAPLDCAPCRARACRNPSGPVCMTELTAEVVLELLGPGA